MSTLFDEKTYKALQEKVQKELEPMMKAIFEYHLEKFKKEEKRKMAGNTTRINNRPELDWYIGDSKIDDLIDWLNRNGVKNEVNHEPSVDKIEMLKIWLKDLTYPYKNAQFIQDVQGSNEPNIERKWKFNLYTQRYLYHIIAIDTKKNDGYLGCTYSCRTPRAGEGWTRGSDLPDGVFTKETWERIKNAILRNEFVELASPIIPIPDECGEECVIPITEVSPWNPKDILCDECGDINLCPGVQCTGCSVPNCDSKV